MATRQRRVLFFAPLRHTFADLCATVRRQSWVKAEVGERRCTWHGRNLAFVVDLVETVEQAAELIGSQYYNLLVLDCRNLPGEAAAPERQAHALEELFAAMRAGRDLERRYPRGRIVVLVGDSDEERVDRLIFAMGQRHVGACLRDWSLATWMPAERREEAGDRLVDQLWTFCHGVMTRRRKGAKAICAAGGGISGMYYELGVLKCLQDVLSLDVRNFDMFFGISAGAVVSSWLANRISVTRCWPGSPSSTAAGATTSSSPGATSTSRRCPAASCSPTRSCSAICCAWSSARTCSASRRWSARGPCSSAPSSTRASSSGSSARCSRSRADQRLPRLARQLYIGATDQDRREHVMFGDRGLDDVPISKAIQASIAMHPFFPSVEIGGRYYTDGVVTRTSNIKAAIEHGADLVFVLDPFVPLITDDPGFNARHGNLWIFEQDLKTMSFTRFEQVRDELMRQNPHVSLYTFVPSNRMRRLMSSQNPFVARNFDAIVCEAYRSTRRRLSQLEYRLRGDLAGHGITLDLTPAMAKVERLARRPPARRPPPGRRRRARRFG